ncbi:MAG: hypothetical protein Q4E38_07105 [Eubacteriales bacterium]|nr:hypothetical protein [Eubacteriales bacterium]
MLFKQAGGEHDRSSVDTAQTAECDPKDRRASIPDSDAHDCIGDKRRQEAEERTKQIGRISPLGSADIQGDRQKWKTGRAEQNVDNELGLLSGISAICRIFGCFSVSSFSMGSPIVLPMKNGGVTMTAAPKRLIAIAVGNENITPSAA